MAEKGHRNKIVLLMLSSVFLFGCGSGESAEQPDAESYPGNADTEAGEANDAGGYRERSQNDVPRNIALYMLDDIVREVGEEIKPADFFDTERIKKEKPFDLQLLSDLSFIVFPTEEELCEEGDYPVTIAAGEYELTSNVIIRDTIAPVITVEAEKEYERGETILYRSGVEVTDNSKLIPELEIDSSEVESNMPGKYTVYYSATDKAGNTGYAEGYIIIKDEHVPTENEVNQLADELLDRLLTVGMSDFEKAGAVFDWCQENIRLTAKASKESVLYGAYEGLRYNEGDCFTSFATGKWLLERCGIPTIDLTHKTGEATHYWSLVNTGGGWYHFDCSHLKGGFRCFMQTDEQVREFAAGEDGNSDDFKIDQTDIPERATRILYTARHTDP